MSESAKELRGEEISHLTLQQYNSMSVDEKTHIHNRVCQWALKARDSMPNDNHGIFCLVASHLLKKAHRYFNLSQPPD